MKKGDILYTKSIEDNEAIYHIYKVLEYETGYNTVHVLSYEPMSNQPTKDDIPNLVIHIYHAPIAADGFGNAVLLDNRLVEDSELIGYLYYLKLSLLTLTKEELDEELSKLNKKSEE